MDHFQIFKKRCIELMNKIEQKTKILMHEKPDTKKLESAFWIAVDKKNIQKIRSIHNQLNIIYQELKK